MKLGLKASQIALLPTSPRSNLTIGLSSFALKQTSLCLKEGLFVFLVSWTKHPNFGNFMKENWKPRGLTTDSLFNLTEGLKKWNNSVYGHITTRKRSLMHKLSMVQEQIDASMSNLLASQKVILGRNWRKCYDTKRYSRNKKPNAIGFILGIVTPKSSMLEPCKEGRTITLMPFVTLLGIGSLTRWLLRRKQKIYSKACMVRNPDP